MTSVGGSPRQRGAGSARGRGGRGPGGIPLAGVRILDLIEGGAGALASKLFVELGAEVIKVEPPGGDPLRRRRAVPARTAER